MRKTASLLLLGTMLCLPFFASARRVAIGTYTGSRSQDALVNSNWDTYDILIYTSVGVNADGTLAIPSQGTTLDAFKTLIIDRATVPPAHNLRGMVSIGGRASGPGFVKAVQPQRVGQFVAAIKALVDQYNLAGVDIDWEYPGIDVGSCRPGTQDLEDFGNFIVQLKSTLALPTSPTSTLPRSTPTTPMPPTPPMPTPPMPTTSAPTSPMPTMSVPTSTMSIPTPTTTPTTTTTTTTTIPLPSSPTSTLPTPTPTSTMSTPIHFVDPESVVLHKLVTVTAPLNIGSWGGTGHAKIVGNSDYIIIKMGVDPDSVETNVVPIAPLPVPSSAPSSCVSRPVDVALSLWMGVGIPSDKIILGFPTSGRRYAVPQLSFPTVTDIYWTYSPVPTDKPKGSARDQQDEGDACRPGTGTFPGRVSYLDLFNSDPGFPALLVSGDAATPETNYYWDVCSLTPFLYLSALKQLVMFDNPKSFAAKGSFVATGYAGFAVLDAQDDRHGELAQAIAQKSG